MSCLSCHSTKSAESQLMTATYPYLSLGGTILAFTLSLTAPCAAAYITYTTLNNEDFGNIIPWLVMVSISIVRLIFSNFTLDNLLQRFLLAAYKQEKCNQNEVEYRQNEVRLIGLKKIVAKADSSFFAQIPSEDRVSLVSEDESNVGITLQNHLRSQRCHCTIL